MVRFLSSVQPPGQPDAGWGRSTEVTRAQAEVLADALRASGFDVVASRGTIEGATEPCDGVVFQDLTLAALVWTGGAWVMGDLSSGEPTEYAAALVRLTELLEERYGWVPRTADD